MQACKRLGQRFIIPCQATKACRPRIAALHHPALRQQHKAFLASDSLTTSRDLMMGHCRLGRLVPGVALVDRGECDRGAGDLLHLGGQRPDLAPVLLMGGGDMQRQQMAQHIHRQMHLRAPTAFGAIIARSCASRSTSRRLCTTASNTPALSQRWLCWYTVCQGAGHGAASAMPRPCGRSSAGR